MLIWENVNVKEKMGKGKTLYASRDIRKDEIIMVIAGPIVNVPTIYTIPIDDNLFIDPVPYGNPAKYLCHDCEPSAGVKDRTLLVAFRDIKQGEEVAIDYAMIVYDYRSEMTSKNRKCHCGKPTCRKKLGCWKDLPINLKRKYNSYKSDYLKFKTRPIQNNYNNKAA